MIELSDWYLVFCWFGPAFCFCRYEVYDEKITKHIVTRPDGVLAGILRGAYRRKKRKSPPWAGQKNYRKEICT